MAIKRIFDIGSSTGRRCLKCGYTIERQQLINSKHTCAHCGQEHLVSITEGKASITKIEHAYLHHEFGLNKYDRLRRDKALLKIEIKQKNAAIVALEKENKRLTRKLERLEGKNVLQNECTEEADEESV